MNDPTLRVEPSLEGEYDRDQLSQLVDADIADFNTFLTEGLKQHSLLEVEIHMLKTYLMHRLGVKMIEDQSLIDQEMTR
jgi:phospholipase/lecithinase/hemolysin